MVELNKTCVGASVELLLMMDKDVDSVALNNCPDFVAVEVLKSIFLVVVPKELVDTWLFSPVNNKFDNLILAKFYQVSFCLKRLKAKLFFLIF